MDLFELQDELVAVGHRDALAAIILASLASEVLFATVKATFACVGIKV